MPGDHPTKKCTFPSCGRPLRAKGVCSSHYEQISKGKDLVPLYLDRRKPGSPPIIEYDEAPCPNDELEGPCHIFKGRKNDGGYGMVSIKCKQMRVHRYLWELANGPIPEGMVMDHRCRNRACCNINHLRLVTRKVNSTENVIGSSWQLEAAKTHSVRGHLLDEKTTRIDRKGHRYCRKCQRIRNRGYYHADN